MFLSKQVTEGQREREERHIDRQTKGKTEGRKREHRIRMMAGDAVMGKEEALAVRGEDRGHPLGCRHPWGRCQWKVCWSGVESSKRGLGTKRSQVVDVAESREQG